MQNDERWRPRIVTFGETMLRLSPPGARRLDQSDVLEVFVGGAETNVAVALSRLGVAVRHVTRLPDNELGRLVISKLRSHGVDPWVELGGRRLGLYFLEMGAGIRAGNVLYDREGSATADIEPGLIDWPAAFSGASWFHTSGITPAVSASAAATTVEAMEHARALGLTVSFDLNYRSKLWRWGRSAREVLPGLVERADVLIGNIHAVDQALGIAVPGQAARGEAYGALAEAVFGAYPKLRLFTCVAGSGTTAADATWSGFLARPGPEVTVGPELVLREVIDRVGAGDAFAAGLIWALQGSARDDPEVISLAVAAGALKHTFRGDFSLASIDELEQLAAGAEAPPVRR